MSAKKPCLQCYSMSQQHMHVILSTGDSLSFKVFIMEIEPPVGSAQVAQTKKENSCSFFIWTIFWVPKSK